MEFDLEVRSQARSEFVDLTQSLQNCVRQSGVDDGFCYVAVPHTTAAIVVNENYDPSVKSDILAVLDRLIPWHDDGYTHDEGNSAAHVKSCLLGTSKTLRVASGRLELGTWQGVFLGEFDGPRTRRVRVSIVAAPEK